MGIGISGRQASLQAIKHVHQPKSLHLEPRLAPSIVNGHLSLVNGSYGGDGCVQLRAEPPQRRFWGTRSGAVSVRCRVPRREYDRAGGVDDLPTASLRELPYPGFVSLRLLYLGLLLASALRCSSFSSLSRRGHDDIQDTFYPFSPSTIVVVLSRIASGLLV